MNTYDAKYMALKIQKLKQIINKEKTVITVASELNVSRQSIHKWLNRYKQYGIDELITKKKSGCKKAHNRTSPEIEELVILKSVGAIVKDGHFVYASEMHGDEYVNKDELFPHVDLISQICEVLADHFRTDDINTVIGPTIGGVIMSTWTAYHMSQMQSKQTMSTYAEKDSNSDFIIRPSQNKHITGKRILVVDDVLNRGGSCKKVIDAVHGIDGIIVGVGVLCNRGNITADKLGVSKLVALTSVKMQAYNKEDCPFCKVGIPINTELGKGYKYYNKREV